MISAHYGLSDVFDNLIISLCKFTALSSEVSVEREKSGEDMYLEFQRRTSFSHGLLLSSEMIPSAYFLTSHLIPIGLKLFLSVHLE